MAVDTQYEVASGFTEDEVAYRGASMCPIGNVPVVFVRPVLEVLQGNATGSLRGVVDDHEVDIVQDLGVVEANSLNGEVNTIVVTGRRHPDRQELALLES